MLKMQFAFDKTIFLCSFSRLGLAQLTVVGSMLTAGFTVSRVFVYISTHHQIDVSYYEVAGHVFEVNDHYTAIN